ncbi:MAG: hypothetical protein KIS66_15080 [Fimbriimonadaceae bacterium]|nr:hypothetical protein [Fimbriimonadaceae bacterium]
MLSAAFGCRAPEKPPFETFFEPAAPTPILKDGPNAFDGYAAAALEAESRAGDYLNWVSFPPSHRAELAKRLTEPLRLVQASARKTCAFRYDGVRPFEVAPYRRGWRMLGRAIVWRIEKAVAAGEYDAAISDLGLATKFGFDLSGGATADASLGFAIVDEARRAFLTCRVQLSADQLERVGSVVQQALAAVPSADRTLEHEGRAMLAAVQYVQDAYRSGSYTALIEHLGLDVKNATDRLEQMSKNDAKERPAYFRAFAQRARDVTAWYRKAAALSAQERSLLKAPEEGTEPWRRFARQFFTAPGPYLRARDRVLARSRLLAIDAWALAKVKRSRAAPKSLAVLERALTTDPYSGKEFRYSSVGTEYRLYSVGANFEDDGGETNEDFDTPDLVLERPSPGSA